MSCGSGVQDPNHFSQTTLSLLFFLANVEWRTLTHGWNKVIVSFFFHSSSGVVLYFVHFQLHSQDCFLVDDWWLICELVLVLFGLWTQKFCLEFCLLVIIDCCFDSCFQDLSSLDSLWCDVSVVASLFHIFIRLSYCSNLLSNFALSSSLSQINDSSLSEMKRRKTDNHTHL